jgi:hypothetical protein
MNTKNKHARPTDLKTGAEIDSEMARIDGINGAAGHRVEDPVVRAILRRQISGAISGDEARAEIASHLDHKWGH